MTLFDPLPRLTALAGVLRFRFLALVIAAPLLPLGGGGLTPTEALAIFKTNTNATVKVLRDELLVAKQTLLAQILAYENAVNSGTAIDAATSTFYTDCTTFQSTVMIAGHAAMSEIGQFAVDALDSISGGAALNGAYPKDFFNGTGGAYDKVRKNVRTSVDRLYKPLAGRLKKTVKTLETNGASLAVELRPPFYLEEFSFSEDEFSFFADRFALDTLVAVNTLAQAEDGRVWVGGAVFGSIAEVTVSVMGAITETDDMAVMPDSNRFSATMIDGGTFFKKGNYAASVKAGTDTGRAAGATFSLR
jgi:hypothetical protein